jgi:CubicO group peptidase (beta-lactamase class C family)
MVEVQGRCEDRFESVRKAFAANFERGDDVGASVAVTLDGALVVDLWGGDLCDSDDGSTTGSWAEDTIINVYSTTKTMSFLCVLLLADRGQLDLDASVDRYWPEFGTGNKAGVVLVRHLMAHTAGLSGWNERLEIPDLYDHEKLTRLLAAQEPWWEPGSRSGYHALTQGYLLGELVRRVDGRSIGTLFAEELAAPLEADFHIGLPASHDTRVTHVIPVQPIDPADAGVTDSTSVAYRTFANPRLTAEASFTEAWRRAEIPAAGGHGNARSVATAQRLISCGGEVGGKRLMSERICDRIFEVQAAGRDLVLGVGVTFGIGYGLNSPRAPISPSQRVAYWGGWGGSLVVNDLDTRMTMAYVMNRMGEGTVGDNRAHTILRAVYAALGIEATPPRETTAR